MARGARSTRTRQCPCGGCYATEPAAGAGRPEAAQAMVRGRHPGAAAGPAGQGRRICPLRGGRAAAGHAVVRLCPTLGGAPGRIDGARRWRCRRTWGRRRRPPAAWWRRITARLSSSIAAMEPLNCTAWVHDDRIELWVPTQLPELCRSAAARVAGVSLHRRRCHAAGPRLRPATSPAAGSRLRQPGGAGGPGLPEPASSGGARRRRRPTAIAR